MPTITKISKFEKFVRGLSGKHSGFYKGKVNVQQLQEKFAGFMNRIAKRRAMNKNK